MAQSTKVKHVDKRPNGVLRFRRRFPKNVAEVLSKPALQVHIKNCEGLAFHREYQAIMQEFGRIVSDFRSRINDNDMRLPIERWHEALLRREELVSEVIGLEDDPEFAAREIAKGLSEQPNTDPLLLKALVNPDADAPKLPLQDAKTIYARDKHMPENEVVRLDRITRRLEEALGPLNIVPLEGLRRDHGRRYMNLMLKTTKSDGQPLSVATCSKESKIISAMLNRAMREGDVDTKNPFIGLPWPKDTGPKVNKKLPLPDDLADCRYVRTLGTLPVNSLIWGGGSSYDERRARHSTQT